MNPEMIGEALLHSLIHSLLDTLKISLFLFVSYLLMELFEHHAGKKSENIIKNSGRIGPLVGGLLGAVPQCGFSAAAAGLYSGRLITRGTLIAVFLATSDEMLPIMLSATAEGRVSPLTLLSILGVKVVGGIAVGFLIDLITKENAHEAHVSKLCEHEGCNCSHDGIWLSTLKHTAKVAIFVLLTTFIVTFGVELIGEDRLGSLLHSLPVVGELAAALIGLIPNCAASVVITELYIGGTISAGQMLAGLFTGSGVGLLVLFRTNRSIRENLLLTGILYVCGVALGLLVGATGLASLIGL